MDYNKVSERTPARPSIGNAGTHTGWAIAFSVVAAIFFYVIYQFLFALIIDAYASYDPSFATGLGALVLFVFGSNVLAFLSGAVVARKAFPKANTIGLFYGLATLLVAFAVLSVFRELGRSDANWIVAGVNVVVIVITIFAVRVALLIND